MKKLLFLIVLFPFLSFAQDDWEYVGKTNDGNSFYIKDVEKKDYGNKALFWSKSVLPDKKIKTKKGIILKKGGYNIAKGEVDCKDKTLKMLISVSYDEKGSVIDTYTGPFFAEPVIPDSMGETLLQTSCNQINTTNN